MTIANVTLSILAKIPQAELLNAIDAIGEVFMVCKGQTYFTFKGTCYVYSREGGMTQLNEGERISGDVDAIVKRDEEGAFFQELLGDEDDDQDEEVVDVLPFMEALDRAEYYFDAIETFNKYDVKMSHRIGRNILFLFDGFAWRWSEAGIEQIEEGDEIPGLESGAIWTVEFSTTGLRFCRRFIPIRR